MDGNFFPALSHAFLHCQNPLSLHDFFDLILPEQGLFCLAFTDAKAGGPWHHETFSNIDEMEHRCHALEAEDHWQIYFAPCSYINEFGIAKDDDKKWGRTADNVAYSHCLWVDMDVGEGKDYKNLGEAGDALKKFIELSSLSPSTIVYSGTGLHVYWRLDRALKAGEWKSLADRFKKAITFSGFVVDHARTADLASVLRPPFTTNRKGILGNVVMAYRGTSYTHATIDEIEQALSFVLAKHEHTAVPIESDATKSVRPSMPWYEVLTEKAKEAVLRSALWSLPKKMIADHDDWFKIGASLKCEGSLPEDVLFHLWRDWSNSSLEGAEKWSKVKESLLRYRFGTPYKSHIGVLLRLAEESGWNPDLLVDSTVREQVLDAMEKHNDRWTNDQAKSFLKENVVYISSEDKFLYNGVLHTKIALDRTLARWMPLAKDKRPLSAGTLATNSEVAPIAQYLGYMPGAPRIYKDKRGYTCANSYQSPERKKVNPSQPDVQTVIDFINHMSNGDPETRAGIYRIFSYLAYIHLNPGQRLRWMTVLIGESQGSGKSTLMRRIPEAMLGASNVRPVDVRELASDFSGYLSGAQLLSGEEVWMGGYRDALMQANKLKALISEDDVVTVGKGKDGRIITNTATFFGTSNHIDAVVVEEGDRRNDIIRTTSGKMPDELTQRLNDLVKNRKDSLTTIVLAIAKKYGIKVNPNSSPPESKAKREARDAFKASWAVALHDRYEAGLWPFSGDCVALSDVMQFVASIEQSPPSSKAVQTELRTMCPDAFPTVLAQKHFPAPIGKKQARVLILRNRKIWQEKGPSALYEHYEETTLKNHFGHS